MADASGGRGSTLAQALPAPGGATGLAAGIDAVLANGEALGLLLGTLEGALALLGGGGAFLAFMASAGENGLTESLQLHGFDAFFDKARQTVGSRGNGAPLLDQAQRLFNGLRRQGRFGEADRVFQSVVKGLGARRFASDGGNVVRFAAHDLLKHEAERWRRGHPAVAGQSPSSMARSSTTVASAPPPTVLRRQAAPAALAESAFHASAQRAERQIGRLEALSSQRAQSWKRLQGDLSRFYQLSAGGRAAAPALVRTLRRIDVDVRQLQSFYKAANAPLAALKAVQVRLPGLSDGSAASMKESLRASDKAFDAEEVRDHWNLQTTELQRWLGSAWDGVSRLARPEPGMAPGPVLPVPFEASRAVERAYESADRLRTEVRQPPLPAYPATPRPVVATPVAASSSAVAVAGRAATGESAARRLAQAIVQLQDQLVAGKMPNTERGRQALRLLVLQEASGHYPAPSVAARIGRLLSDLGVDASDTRALVSSLPHRPLTRADVTDRFASQGGGSNPPPPTPPGGGPSRGEPPEPGEPELEPDDSRDVRLAGDKDAINAIVNTGKITAALGLLAFMGASPQVQLAASLLFGRPSMKAHDAETVVVQAAKKGATGEVEGAPGRLARGLSEAEPIVLDAAAARIEREFDGLWVFPETGPPVDGGKLVDSLVKRFDAEVLTQATGQAGTFKGTPAQFKQRFDVDGFLDKELGSASSRAAPRSRLGLIRKRLAGYLNEQVDALADRTGRTARPPVTLPPATLASRVQSRFGNLGDGIEATIAYDPKRKVFDIDVGRRRDWTDSLPFAGKHRLKPEQVMQIESALIPYERNGANRFEVWLQPGVETAPDSRFVIPEHPEGHRDLTTTTSAGVRNLRSLQEADAPTGGAGPVTAPRRDWDGGRFRPGDVPKDFFKGNVSPVSGPFAGVSDYASLQAKVNALLGEGTLRRLQGAEDSSVARIYEITGSNAGKTDAAPDLARVGRLGKDEFMATVAAGRLGVGAPVRLDESFYLPDTSAAADGLTGRGIMVMEQLPGQSFAKTVGYGKRVAAGWSNDELRNVTDDLMTKGGRLHSAGWINNDAHGGNVILDRTSQTAKIIDYGEARKLTYANKQLYMEEMERLTQLSQVLRPAGETKESWFAHVEQVYMRSLESGHAGAAQRSLSKEFFTEYRKGTRYL